MGLNGLTQVNQTNNYTGCEHASIHTTYTIQLLSIKSLKGIKNKKKLLDNKFTINQIMKQLV